MGISLIDKLRLLADLNRASKEVQEGISMKNSTKVVAAVIGLITAILQIPSVQLALEHVIALHPAIAFALGGISGILALLHVPVSDGTKAAVMALLALFLLAPGVSRAQSISASSDAVAVHYNGEWSAGTIVSETYDLIDTGKNRAGHIYLQGVEVLAPTPGLSVYAGGLKYEPDLSSLLAKTNVPAGTFGLTFNAALGNGLPASGGSHISTVAGVGVRYRATAALSWNALQVQYLRYGGTSGALISTGLSYIFK